MFEALDQLTKANPDYDVALYRASQMLSDDGKYNIFGDRALPFWVCAIKIPLNTEPVLRFTTPFDRVFLKHVSYSLVHIDYDTKDVIVLSAHAEDAQIAIQCVLELHKDYMNWTKANE